MHEISQFIRIHINFDFTHICKLRTLRCQSKNDPTKNISRTFEAQKGKIFKNIEP